MKNFLLSLFLALGMAGSVQAQGPEAFGPITVKTINGVTMTPGSGTLDIRNFTLHVSQSGTLGTAAFANVTDLLPSQTGNAGKFLQTDGTHTLWGTVTPYSPAQFAIDSAASPAAGKFTTVTSTGMLSSGDSGLHIVQQSNTTEVSSLSWNGSRIQLIANYGPLLLTNGSSGGLSLQPFNSVVDVAGQLHATDLITGGSIWSNDYYYFLSKTILRSGANKGDLSVQSDQGPHVMDLVNGTLSLFNGGIKSYVINTDGSNYSLIALDTTTLTPGGYGGNVAMFNVEEAGGGLHGLTEFAVAFNGSAKFVVRNDSYIGFSGVVNAPGFAADGGSGPSRFAGGIGIQMSPAGSGNPMLRLTSNDATNDAALIYGSDAFGNLLFYLSESGKMYLGHGGDYILLKQNGAALDFRNSNDTEYLPTQSLYNRYGSGTPEGAVAAPVGASYHRTDGGAGTALYVKESGAGNTGWVAK